MRIDEYASFDATGLAELLRARAVSADEVRAAALEAIALVNPQINAVASGPWERPLDHADDGPFHGVPFVLKDLGAHAAGVAQRMGTRLSGDGVVWPGESFLVRRFRAAGLAIVGATTTPELGLGVNTEALVYGSTRNPWDLGRSAGGSSGGSGALVAAGAVPIAHGNDGGGSIRVPSAFNGLVGLKPSHARISNGPGSQEPGWGLASEGVLTRSMRDCARLLDVMAGPMPGDRVVLRQPERPWSEEVGADVGRLRIAVHTESWSAAGRVDPEVAQAVEAVARTLASAGHDVGAAAPAVDGELVMSTTLTLGAAGFAEGLEQIAAAVGRPVTADVVERVSWQFYERGRRTTALEIGAARRSANQLARSVGEFFTRWDLLVTPTADVPPPPLGHVDTNHPSQDADDWAARSFGTSSFTPLFNVSGSPAISLPLGSTRDGLPIGVQLIAPVGDEATLIRVGSMLEALTPWRSRRPLIHAAVPK